ncbi:MAG TPA: efflux RND transporter periplasmic adaptor subunit [Fimbriiglobus sp.]|nr:efflux RND transporter periplasmic adaptor subunit [Fimbriiglobus sp.]
MPPPELQTAPPPTSRPSHPNGSRNPALSLPPLAAPAARSGRKRGGGRLLRYGALALLLGGLAYAGITYGLPDRKAADVITAKATRGDLVITVTDRGELESANSAQVNCEVEGGGKIATILPEGTRVKKGDEVCRFDTDVLKKGINEQTVKWQQAVNKAKAARSELEVQQNKELSEIDKANLALKLAEIDLDSYTDVKGKKGEYQVEVDKRRGAIELANMELQRAKDDLEFTQGLVKKGFAQLEQLPTLELTVKSKEYAVSEKKADLHLFENFTSHKKQVELKAKSRDAERELVRTKKSQAAATEKADNEVKSATTMADLEDQHLKRLREQMEKCVVRAPQDGIVIYYNRRYWDESSRIRPGGNVYFQQPIFTLPDLDNMQVKMSVHESVVKKVLKGMPATMQIEALRGQVLHGTVKSVATLAQNDRGWGNAVKEYETLITITDLPSEAGLRPGMTAEVTIRVKTIPNALTVPVSAVTESGGEHICYVKTGGGLERREVTIGEANEQNIQILEGLEEGEEVALDARVRAAAEVKAGEGKDKEKDKEKKDAKKEKAPAAPPPGPAKK